MTFRDWLSWRPGRQGGGYERMRLASVMASPPILWDGFPYHHERALDDLPSRFRIDPALQSHCRDRSDLMMLFSLRGLICALDRGLAGTWHLSMPPPSSMRFQNATAIRIQRDRFRQQFLIIWCTMDFGFVLEWCRRVAFLLRIPSPERRPIASDGAR